MNQAEAHDESRNTLSTADLLRAAAQGDQYAWGSLNQNYGPRLRRAIAVRLDPRLRNRLDPSDIVQEAMIEAAKGIDNYIEESPLSFYLWLRMIALRRLLNAHREHLDAERRDVRKEISLDRRICVEASSEALADELIARDATPCTLAAQAERKIRVLAALESLEQMDREVLTLRHIEQLSPGETAEALGIELSAASKRYVRALDRLRQALEVESDGSSIGA